MESLDAVDQMRRPKRHDVLHHAPEISEIARTALLSVKWPVDSCRAAVVAVHASSCIGLFLWARRNKSAEDTTPVCDTFGRWAGNLESPK